MIGRLSAVAISLALLFGVCSCSTADADPDRILSAEKASAVRLYDGRPLPSAARNIYRAEYCGKDCEQLLRFDLPAVGARESLLELTRREPQEFDDREQLHFIKVEFSAYRDRHWIARESVEGAWGSTLLPSDGSPLIRFLAQPDGSVVHVFLFNFTM